MYVNILCIEHVVDDCAVVLLVYCWLICNACCVKICSVQWLSTKARILSSTDSHISLPVAGRAVKDRWTLHRKWSKLIHLLQRTYFTYCMPCSCTMSSQWLPHLLVAEAASKPCDWARVQQMFNCLWLLSAVVQVDCVLCPHLCKVCVVLQWPLLSWFMKTRSPRGSAGFLHR